MAMAETPAPTLIGVERILISCDLDAGLSEAEQREVCDQLVTTAKRVTNLPVLVATPREALAAGNLRAQSKQLILRVSGTAGDVEDGRKSLALNIEPVRLARKVAFKPVQSSATLMQVQGKWLIQGHVQALSQLLGGGTKLKAPILSDR